MRRRASVISRKARCSHDIVSDEFSWSSSDLIVRLNFLVSVRHRHRYERTFSQSLEVCTFEPLLLQVLADWPTNEPLPVLVHQVSSQL